MNNFLDFFQISITALVKVCLQFTPCVCKCKISYCKHNGLAGGGMVDASGICKVCKCNL